MPAVLTPNCGIPRGWNVDEGGWDVGDDLGRQIIDCLLLGAVKSQVATLPSSGQAAGDVYLLTAGAATHANEIAMWLLNRAGVGGWVYLVPKAGWRVQVADELDALSVPKVYAYTGSTWVLPAGSGGGAGMANPMTTEGDLIVGGAAGVPARLPVGATGKVLGVAAGSPVWVDPPASGTSLPVVRSITANETLGLASINTFGVNATTSNYVSTIPAQATVAWTADAEIHFLPSNTGYITITAAAGVSLNGVVAGSLTLSTKNGAAMIKRIGGDSWWVGGSSVMTVVPPPNAYWDATRKGSIVTLSESNMTAARTGGSNGSGNSFVATAKGVSAGKFYLEIVLSSYNPNGVTGANSSPTVGVISDASATALANSGTVTKLDGATANQRAYYQRGGDAAYGGTTFSMPSISLGGRWRIAVDATAKRVWFGSAAGWNGNPETGVGGGDISAFNGDIYICFAGWNTTNAPDGVTLKVSDGDFLYSKPGGFVSFETV